MSRSASELKVLVIAYSCEPHRGSEPGVGWMWSRALAGFADVWTLARASQREAIENALPQTPERENMHFLYPTDGPIARRLRFGPEQWGRWHYLAWQRAALALAREAHAEVGFDLVWHFTFATAWLGSFGGRIGPPFIYGPVGGGVGMPVRFLTAMGPRGVLFEAVRSAARAAGRYLNPLTPMAWSDARLILANNEDTKRWTPRRHRARTDVFPNSIIEEIPETRRPRRAGTPTAMFGGRLLAWKGVVFAVRAMKHLPDWRLIVCGDGPDRKRLEKLAHSLGVAGRIDFRGWVPRNEVLGIMENDADVFLFPSLHDDAPLAVIEAIASGLPVVCLDRGGPPLLSGPCGFVVSAAAPTEHVAADLASACRRALGRGVDPEIAAAHVGEFTIAARRRRAREFIDHVLSA